MRMRLIRIKMVLGGEYLLGTESKVRCKLIRVTKKGYNLLGIEKHKCLLKSHMYITGGEESGKLEFTVPECIRIIQAPKKELV